MTVGPNPFTIYVLAGRRNRPGGLPASILDRDRRGVPAEFRPGDPDDDTGDRAEMSVQQQLTVGWQNRPGELANFCEALAGADINIIALATAEAGEYGAVRLIVDDVDRARAIFRDKGVAHTSIEVLVFELENRPGALADVARDLADHTIVIEYFYASTAPGSDSVIGVFKVSDPQAADELLGAGGQG